MARFYRLQCNQRQNEAAPGDCQGGRDPVVSMQRQPSSLVDHDKVVAGHMGFDGLGTLDCMILLHDTPAANCTHPSFPTTNIIRR